MRLAEGARRRVLTPLPGIRPTARYCAPGWRWTKSAIDCLSLSAKSRNPGPFGDAMSGSFCTFTWMLLYAGVFIDLWKCENVTKSSTSTVLGSSLITTVSAPTDTNTSSTDSPSHGTINSTSETSNTTDMNPPEVESSEGLSPGAAAGVAVGTIAGVAVLGGGIFAGLKFSGRIGG
ncbi:hypothetical protein GN956_G24759 [Arapaima gigas]